MKKTILFFGEAAYELADFFRARQFEFQEKFINLNYKKPEQIEAHFLEHDLGLQLDNESEIWAILVAGNAINFASLSVLQQCTHVPIKIFYIIPDLVFEDATVKTNHKITYNILQEYTRSGKFQKMFLFDVCEIEKMFEDLSFLDYKKRIYDIIAYSIILWDQSQDYVPYISTVKEEDEIARLVSLGFLDINNFGERFLFTLDFPKEIVYKFLVDKKKIESKEFRNNVMKYLKSKSASESKIMFEVIEIENQNIALIVQKSQIIQQTKEGKING